MERPAWDRQFAETETERNARLRQSRRLAAARREGVIQGLDWVLRLVSGQRTRPLNLQKEIRAEIERLTNTAAAEPRAAKEQR